MASISSTRIIFAGMNLRQLFLHHVGQTSSAPLAIEIVKAEGCVLYDAGGREYIDLIGGISVANTGHCHPKVIAAIEAQVRAYMHVMVYGELVLSPQVQYAKLLTDHLPDTLNSVYFTNSGAEAVEGAMKLAKRATGRTEIIGFKASYHGSTQGALSIIGDEYWRQAYRPLLPDVQHLTYNSFEELALISGRTACVVVEPVQAEAGVRAPHGGWLAALRQRCTETGTLLVFDEIQTGFGRTGRLWAFEHSGVVPDILLLGKALGGGMPMGAFISDRNIMNLLADAPVLGHITTFGGHPVCCAAGMAGFNVLLEEGYISDVAEKEALFRQLLHHPAIQSVHSCGLWMGVGFEDFTICKAIIDQCITAGLFTDWFLFAPNSLRISPPLSITREQIEQACAIINACT